ncbi:MAG TPA: extracellular solute-binding protein [Armatimonadota bacterium]|jgi:multiple sugar transport system permease protein
MHRYLFIWSVLLLGLLASLPGWADDGQVVVKQTGLWWGIAYGATSSDPLVKLMRDDPTIAVEDWSGINLPGGAGRTPLMLSMAGQTEPDLYLSWFHIIRNDISQGFCYPLNDWIGQDDNGNEQIDPEEATWPEWRKVPPLWRQVATREGKVYGVPLSSTNYMGIIYRIDLVQKAGLDPDHPPKTWDEFMYWCQKLTIPGKKITGAKLQRGQRGFAVPNYGFTWLPWLQSTGGSPVVQIKIDPKTGKRYEFSMETTDCRNPDTGEDMNRVLSQWQAGFASQAGERAVGFYHRLRWQPWIRDQRTGEPINLTAEQVKAGKVTLPDGRTVAFKPSEVITGTIRPMTGQPDDNWGEWLARGEVAMAQWFFNDLSSYQNMGINPDLLGVFPIPAGPGGQQVVQVQRHFVVMGEGVSRRPKAERDVVWKVLKALSSPASYDENVRRMVLSGKARFVNPQDLRRLGFSDYLAEVPASLRQLYAGLENGTVLARTEPFMGFWMTMDQAINTNVLSLVLGESGENFAYKRALREVESTANTGTMFARPREQLAPFRKGAWMIFAAVALLVLVFLVMIIRTNLAAHVENRIGSRAGVFVQWLPWLMLMPALGLIAIWGYYPLTRGVVMAFQDYHIVGKSPWVGLDNFLGIFMNPDFYIAIRQTLKFVALNLGLVFLAPILLSLMLSEIPTGKVFWRSVFFLPQLTSGLVIALLWKLMYDPTENGLANQLMALFHLKSMDWLGNPHTAMISTIIPSVWAGMGISSLIYLAALKGIPDELYEAAGLDGAGLLDKLRHITIPQLMPLIIINFVGAFIGTFQSMGNIFLLTFGGPGKETMVLSMAIWLEAYSNLRFSTATAMAWVLGSALIGFAYLQIRILRKVEFRRVEEV